MSKARLATESQSLIGLSKTSSIGTAADIGIGARPELQRARMRRQADVDRQHPQLLQQLQHARLGRDRQRHDQHVDAGDAGEFDQFRDGAELGVAGDDAAASACRRDRRRCRRCGCRCRAAVSTERISASAALPPPTMTARRSMRPSRAQRRISLRHDETQAENADEADDEPDAEQQARIVFRHLQDEAGQRHQREGRRPRPAAIRPKVATGRISADTW